VVYTAARTARMPWVLLSYLALGLAALLPRVLDLGSFVTFDEVSFWVRRSALFLHAIQSGDFAATAISDHPGVTTMWLGSAGIGLHSLLLAWGLIHDSSLPTRLALMQLMAALTHVAGILAGYGLLRRLLPAPAALLAALLWAADPFVIGYSRVLHVDALAGTFATLSLLAACLYWHHDPRRRWLALSGVCAGLAILSKSPALALLPIVGLIALAAAFGPDERRKTKDERGSSSFVLRPSSFVALLAWGLIMAVTVVALWPALWASPTQAYEQIRVGVAIEGAEPHMLGNYFLGREDAAPGVLFYPVALALRLTPWTLLGLLLLPLAWRRARDLAPARRDLVVLAGFVVLFVLAMSLFPKKFNRYLVPAFPALDILAAVGLAAIADLWRPRSAIQKLRPYLIPAVVGVLALVNAAFWHPYYIAAYNQALGGAPMGVYAFRSGWGEGLEQVAAWLNQQPDITGVRTAVARTEPLQPYLRKSAQAVVPGDALPQQTGYVVVYIRDIEETPFPPFDQFYRRVPPVYTVHIHGVEYAWIYQVPPPVPQPQPADFGDTLHLRGFELNGAFQPGQQADIKLFWETRGTPRADYSLFVHLIGPGGRRYAQLDLPYPTSQWGANRFMSTHMPLALPSDAPPGIYRLIIGLYDLASGARLPLSTGSPADPAIDGTDALVLMQTDVK
jgi:multisubunit Na+/H+ antiporter MnhB subunit